MLIMLVAHQGQLTGPHDLWAAWSFDPIVVLGLVTTALLYRRSTAQSTSPRFRRPQCFWGGLLAIAVALLSPVDALAGELASAHMVQHVLLVLVAAPLLALGAPFATVLRAVPLERRRRMLQWRRSIVRVAPRSPALAAALAWFLHTGALWFWHASRPYDAAVEHEYIHALEHASLLVTALVFWSLLVPPSAVRRGAAGYGAMLVFTMAMQSVVLALLLTFATRPWYKSYLRTTDTWGLDPLADQQLAGAIMWVPSGFAYTLAGVVLVAQWTRAIDRAKGSSASEWGDSDRRPTVV